MFQAIRNHSTSHLFATEPVKGGSLPIKLPYKQNEDNFKKSSSFCRGK